jgi:hypothetical protein
MSFRYLSFLRRTYEMMGCWLGTVTSNYPRFQVELDPEDWEKLGENVKFMEDLREELRGMIVRLK